MRKAVVYVHGTRAGELMEEKSGRFNQVSTLTGSIFFLPFNWEI
jgi:hypothetical protein